MTIQAAVKMWSLTTNNLHSDDGIITTGQIVDGYSVVTDPEDDASNVPGAPGLPFLGDLYPGTLQMRVVDKEVKKVSPIYYIVVVTWQGEFGTTGGAASDPVGEPPKYTWLGVRQDVPFTQDASGHAITTTNGEPILGKTRTNHYYRVTIKRNYAKLGFDLHSFSPYLRSVNSDNVVTDVGTFPAGTAMLTKFDPITINAAADSYITVNAEIQLGEPYNTTNDKTWHQRILNTGTLIKPIPSEARIVNAVDGNQDKMMTRVMIKADGSVNLDPTTPEMLEKTDLSPLPYAALGLW